MRLIGLSGGIIFILSAVLLGCARQIAQHNPEDVFPLPDAQGCWLDVCFFDVAFNEITPAIAQHPAVMADTVRLSNTVAFSDNRLNMRFMVAPDRTGTALHLLPEEYAIYRVPPGPLMRLGTLLAALGPPESANLLSPYYVTLNYPARGLLVTVSAALRGPNGQARLRPDDPIIALYVYNPLGLLPQTRLYDPRYRPWTGLGTYGVE